MGNIYVSGDVHGRMIEKLSYKGNPELRQLTDKDVLVLCGDIGIMWPGAEKEGKYQLEWLDNKPYCVLAVRGNHDVTPFWNSGKPTDGNGLIKLVGGTLSNPVVDGKVYKKFFMVPANAILDICGHRSLVISGASSHDIWNLVSPHEKERIKRLKREHQFYRVIGKSWWPDENINIPYAFSLLNDYFRITGTYHAYVENLPFIGDGKKRVGYFDYVFTHDCPAFMCDVYARPGDLGRLRPTENEDFLELIKDHINYRYFIHGHMHTFRRYAVTEDDYGKHDIVCVYKDIFKLPDNPRDSNFQDWKFVCQTAQIV